MLQTMNAITNENLELIMFILGYPNILFRGPVYKFYSNGSIWSIYPDRWDPFIIFSSTFLFKDKVAFHIINIYVNSICNKHKLNGQMFLAVNFENMHNCIFQALRALWLCRHLYNVYLAIYCMCEITRNFYQIYS